MSWLRLDDKFTRHPKVLALGSRADRWTWLEVLSYAAEFHGAELPRSVRDVVPYATPTFVAKAVAAGLLEETENGYEIHDWILYTDTPIAEKVAWFLTKHPEASANEVVRQIGGTRTVVLAEVAKHRDGRTSENGTAEPLTEPPSPVHAGARPVPSPSLGKNVLSPTDVGESTNGALTPGERDDELTRLLDKLGASDSDRRAAAADPSRAIATARFTLAQPDIRRPLAYYRKISATGLYPEGAEHVTPGSPRPLVERLANLIRNTGQHDTEAGIHREIADEERRSGETLTDGQRAELLELWRSLQLGGPGELEPPVSPPAGGRLPTVDLPGIDDGPVAA